jgi:hypothetical protein
MDVGLVNAEAGLIGALLVLLSLGGGGRMTSSG